MLLDFFRLSLNNLWRHRARSLLTALGIIIGVAAVVCMAGYGEGSKRAEIASIQALGARNILLASVKPPVDAKPAEDNGKESRYYRIAAYGLTRQDADRICAKEVGPVDMAVPLRRIGEFVHKDSRDFPQAEAYGTSPLLAQVATLPLAKGRFLCDADDLTQNNTAVIGAELARQMFPNQDPIGGQFNIDSHPFTVCGVLDSGAVAGGASAAFAVYLPMETAYVRFGPVRNSEPGAFSMERVEINRLIVRVPEGVDAAAAANRIRRVVDFAHAASKDVEIRVPMELIRQKEHARKIFTVLMVLIAGLSLLVGGIGIMNIMLASVVERTREIGVRRALGATRRQIGAQFLIETTTLSGIGGVLGVMLGLIACGVITWLSGKVAWLNPAIPEVVPVLISFAVSTGVGILFGMYPALRAAAQDPVVALRHD